MSETAFFSWLNGHERARGERSWEELLESAGGPDRVALVAVDMVKGFCEQGVLASDPVRQIVEPVREALTQASSHGVDKFFFPCDAHAEDSPEFQAFPPHCVSGTEESELVESLSALPFSSSFRRFDKGSVSSLVGTDLARSLQESGASTLVCCGDCTDLCLYHLAAGLRFYANHHHLDWEVVVPSNLVATYDLPVETAKELGALPHPGELLERLFLYHLELNGVQVLARLG